MLTVLSANGPSGYRIANSLRFRSSASAYLNRTPSVAGNRKTWTWSAWVKRGSLGANSYPFACAYAASDSGFLGIYFNSDDTLAVSGFNTYWRKTTQVFRDPSAWYHIVVAFDTTQATGANRVKMYINGIQVTAFGTSNDPTLNTDYPINNNQPHFHSCYSLGTPTNFFDGYLAEVNFIDGQALDPSSFGVVAPATGVWSPKRYSGNYGLNGFYLPFSNGTSTTTLGYDSSGNGNNWTTNNISLTAGSTYDWMIDSPTPYQGSSYGVGNYAVLNPLSNVGTTITNANLTVDTGTTNGNYALSSIAIPSSGKWYWEYTPTVNGSESYCGIFLSASNSVAYYGFNGNKYVDTSGSSYGASYGNNDVIGVAVDADSGSITFYKNNSSQGAITHAVAGLFAYFADGTAGSGTTFQANFGQRPFSYTPPTGYKSLCTYNLPTPTIQNGAGYMAATTFTATGTTQSISNAVNSVSFQPNLVWTKARNQASSNYLNDSVRGASKWLSSNQTIAETTDATFITSFNSDGFSLGTGNYPNGITVVGWQWKAGGTAVTNTAGSITSSVSANTTSGFSVVTYTGTNNAGTIGHGLNATPSMIIVKARGDTQNWAVYHVSTGNTGGCVLNLTVANNTTNSGWWNNTSPTSSVFNVGGSTGSDWYTTNKPSIGYVAYCFAAIPGFSAFGSYTGNGSTDGPFVYCGFRPRWILIKRSDAAGTSWRILDTSRSAYNIEGAELYPDTSEAEGASTVLDGLSNGFKIRNTFTPYNASGGTYIYAAFCEVPMKFSLAR